MVALPVRMLVAAVAVLASALVSSPSIGGTETAAAPPSCLVEAGPARAVTGVIDAETIALDDGSVVRLAGVLAPRRPLTYPAEGPWPPERAAVAALSGLVLGRSVALAYAGREMDRYGRRRAHVVVLGEAGRRWVQGELLGAGQARAFALPGSVTCLAEMLALERSARAAAAGLWTNAAYAVRRASRPSELMRLRSTFQIVEGQVTAVSEKKGKVYVNFGSDWRQDFTAGLSRGAGASAAFAGFDAKALIGRMVRVRGWIERRNGPFVAIADPSEIEMVGDEPEITPRATGPAKDERPAGSPPGALDL